jgi:hypothetical protein
MASATWAVIITGAIAVGSLAGCLHYYLGELKRVKQENEMLRDTINIMREMQREIEEDDKSE